MSESGELRDVGRLAPESTGDVVLRVQDVAKHYPIKRGSFHRTTGNLRAVDGVSFDVYHGETLGLVGESGCGKTTMGKMIVRAAVPTSGQIHFHSGSKSSERVSHDDSSIDVGTARGADLSRLRRGVQMIFQNPYTSLNPRHRVRDIIGEPLKINGVARGGRLVERVFELMDQVGLRREYGIRYPHAFSGGQRQRIGIARALALNPRLVVCDEPVSALDVSIQAQILNLLRDLQTQYGLAYIMISHDLGVVQHISDRVAVMYSGKLVELGPTAELFAQPRHPYTKALLDASPKPHPRYRLQAAAISGDAPDASRRIAGCSFRTRCPFAQRICAEEEPPLLPVASADAAHESSGRFAACHFAMSPPWGGAAGSTGTEGTVTRQPRHVPSL
ncbi:ABC transporter ATP-binding protein [Phytoactinopolyspora endophytica]|uniref:ABC transporter ATP-binding protein n=1 Tax=Phytoactinopolyspora endophytica TaxID=1642495 RepID=UPI001F0F2CC2|nr:oligopeptide/dipeptide ABC transporter ATP-binding protein [Phytoactinopolyspora endophytica]